MEKTPLEISESSSVTSGLREETRQVRDKNAEDTSAPRVSSSALDEQPGIRSHGAVDGKVDIAEEENRYATGLPLSLTVLGLSLSVFLLGLDTSIVGTAIPTITTAFNSLPDVGWYGSSYLLTTCALQPLSGKVYRHFSLKWTYLIFLGLFELGSLLCGAATSSAMLIAGRAVAGTGAAGLFSGALNIVSDTIAPQSRPIYIGIVAASMQFSIALGPLVGGALTQHVSWRWCFYINLPAGAVVAILLILFFNPREREASTIPLYQKLKHLDIPGFAIFLPSVAMLLLAIQWGGTTHPWNSSTIIGLLCGFVATILAFVWWQWHQQKEASIPPRIFLNRNVATAGVFSFLLFGAMQLRGYYLPIWFQVIKRVGPTESGVDFLASAISGILGTLVSGGLGTRLGYYNPWLFVGAALMSIGAGLLSTLTADSVIGQWLGFQVIMGLGVGFALVMIFSAIMTLLPAADVSVGNALVCFCQFLGGAIFLAVAESLFSSELVKELLINAPNVDVEAVVAAGAAGVTAAVEPNDLHGVLIAYNVAITHIFYMAAAASAAAFFVPFGMQWVSVKRKSSTAKEAA